ncbi:hypothetical protein [Acinetobacter sp. YH01009]|uniref:hypothetical protein n=1 Tax=Acinetobacter TaxID=469 RepID=UPI0015D36D40|nr:hypothetical protein [Acinetobacter sp. YH01009]
MGLFTCPQCNEEINTDDKCSTHQVNDLTQDTFCSVECSVEYTLINAVSIVEQHFGKLAFTPSEMEDVLNEFSVEGIQDDDLMSLQSKLKIIQ